MVTLDRRLLAPFAAALVLTAGCSQAATPAATSSGTSAPASTAPAGATTPFAGSWTGTWTRTSPPPGNGTMTFVLQQDGQSITGTVDVTASACLTKGPVSGSVTGTAISLHAVTPAVSGGGQATGEYQGTLSGAKLTGTLTVSCSLGVGVGTWDVSRR